MKPKLTLRDLFWLMLVVAMACAWWADRMNVYRLAEFYSKQATDAWDSIDRMNWAAKQAGFRFDSSDDETITLIPATPP